MLIYIKKLKQFFAYNLKIVCANRKVGFLAPTKSPTWIENAIQKFDRSFYYIIREIGAPVFVLCVIYDHV